MLTVNLNSWSDPHSKLDKEHEFLSTNVFHDWTSVNTVKLKLKTVQFLNQLPTSTQNKELYKYNLL